MIANFFKLYKTPRLRSFVLLNINVIQTSNSR
nr:MAG TPA: hypothetical protein [Caudoviricetes sp.]